MPLQHVNWIAVVVAALATFILGGLWYSPVMFGRAWMLTNNLSEADLRKGNKAKIFGLSFLLALVMSANLAMFLAQPTTTAAWGATAGFLAGFGWVALAIAIVALFERRSWRYVAINGGYMTAAFVIMGVILGAWRR
ncbi:MAG: DUF1761 domain-containing protein [Terriglobales bacterium]